MLTTWTAFSPLDRVFDDVMNSVIGNAFGRAAAGRAFEPECDVRVNDDEIVFSFDVPGLKREDIELTVEHDVLTLKGQRTYQGSGSEKVWLGRTYGAFTKSFQLPNTVDVDKMTAELADGVLTLRIPKNAQAKPRRIEIGAGHEAKQLGSK